MKKNFTLLSLLLLMFACSPSDDSVNDPTDETGNIDNEQPQDNVSNYIEPNVTTKIPQLVSLTNARLNGYIEPVHLSVGDMMNNYSNEFETKGFLLGTQENLTFENAQDITSENNHADEYFIEVEDLAPETQYFYKAYAINGDDEIAYGFPESFTTHGDPDCYPAQDNYITHTPGHPAASINHVFVTDPSGFNEGNLQFETQSGNSTLRIFVQLDEVDAAYPLTGEYHSVYEFNNQTIKSTNEAVLLVMYNGGQQKASLNQATFYIEHIPNESINVIFCDTEVGNSYVLNGKFTVEL